jgi:hypothetical protein
MGGDAQGGLHLPGDLEQDIDVQTLGACSELIRIW